MSWFGQNSWLPATLRSQLPVSWLLALLLLALTLLWVPLPLGSNRLWSAALAAMLVGGVLLLLALGANPRPAARPTPMPPVRWSLGLTLAAAVFGLLWLFGLWQASGGWGGGWLPASWAHPIWAESASILRATTPALGPTLAITPTIALDPTATYTTLLRLALYAGTFVAVYVLAQQAAAAQFLLRVLLVGALAVALYGLTLEALGLNLVLWYEKTAYFDNLTATFINRNHTATFLGLGLLVAVAWVARRWRHAFAAFDPRAWWRDFFARFVGRELVWALLPLLLAVALFLTDSRAGVLATLAGVVVLLVALALNRRVALWQLGLVLVAILLLAGTVLLLAGQEWWGRLQQLGSDIPYRWRVYALMVQAIGENPWLGHGLGNFDQAFRLYRDASVEGWVHKAHNDYLELAFDVGLPMAALAVLAWLYLVWRCLLGVLVRAKDAIYPALGLAASVQVGLHSLTDFSLQIPAVSMVYATLLAMGVAQSFKSRDQRP